MVSYIEMGDSDNSVRPNRPGLSQLQGIPPRSAELHFLYKRGKITTFLKSRLILIAVCFPQRPNGMVIFLSYVMCECFPKR